MKRANHGRLRYSKRWDDGGVASTVGTIMAIMVILALLSLVTNHYVPVWMKDTESNHMELAVSEFGGLKTSMDNQMLFAEVLYYTNREFTSMPVYTAVKVGSDGVPVFASPTQGELGLHLDDGVFTVDVYYTLGNSTGQIYQATQGNIRLDVPNRYYIPQSIIYENGGIIRFQNDGEAMIAESRFSVSNNSQGSNYSYTVSLTSISLFGVGSVSGNGVEGINSKLIGMDFQRYEDLSSSLFINVSTRYGESWFTFYNNTLKESYMPGAVDFSVVGDTTTVETSFYKIVLEEIGFMDYDISVELKNTGSCLNEFNFNVAYMDIAIGQKRGGTDF